MQNTIKTFWPCLALFSAFTLLVLSACQTRQADRNSAAPAAPTYSGPRYLYGTVGSMAQLRGYRPLLVSNYAVVAGLDGTGASSIPMRLRQWMLREVRRRGFGNMNLDKYGGAITPQRFLASADTAIVRVEGLIPPGATPGARFDLLITALHQAQPATSLRGGTLFTAELAVNGVESVPRYSKPLAVAGGATYVNPFEDITAPDHVAAAAQLPTAVVLSGGKVTTERRLELVLNQPNGERCRLIANRINDRFRVESDEKFIAVAKTDQLIRLHIPKRYRHDADRLLLLVKHLFIDESPQFMQQKADQLAQVLIADPSKGRPVALAWEGFGTSVFPTIRRLYEATIDVHVRLAALEAGARLGDARCVDHLADVSRSDDVRWRQRAANTLVFLPRSVVGNKALYQLLDDVDQDVRIAAYESLAMLNDQILHRRPFISNGRFKFLLDLVPASRPLVYVAQARQPRIVIFNPEATFKAPLLVRIWNNRLMLRRDPDDSAVTVFYQRRGQIEGEQYQIAPALANLVLLLAHDPTPEAPTPGMDLSYSHVVNAIYKLYEGKHIEANMALQLSPLVQAVAKARDVARQQRPVSDEKPFVSIDQGS
ncbi:MAG: hypothetical protein CMJ21_05895 [Phycisphaerae bacterium]|nr:hypothetical protein [Phycisphaerae bacterium]